MSPWWGVPQEITEPLATPIWQKICPTCGQPVYGYTALPATPERCVFELVESAARTLEEEA